MGILIRECELATAIPPAKMFKVFLLESHKYVPKIVPQVIKSIEVLEGDGAGAGSLKKTIFAEGLEVKYIKHKVDVVDEKNLIYNYTAIEGEPWMDTLEKVTYETHILPSPNGGSIGKYITKYHPKGDGKIDVDKIKEGEEKGIQMFKAIEAYLLANPDI